MSITVISGIRDLHPDSVDVVEKAIAQACTEAFELRFGGARGADTVALLAAWKCRGEVRRGLPVFQVYVPFTVMEQPAEARAAIEKCADGVRCLGLPKHRRDAWLRRTDAMLDGAQYLITFTDNREDGGTHYAMKRAAELRIPFMAHLVRALPRPR